MTLRLAAITILGVAITGCGTSQTSQPPAASPVLYAAGQNVTISVPEMHCPKMCYPTVEKTLKKQPGVESVALYPQAKTDVIDDRRVRVSLTGAFDAQKTIAALADEGFEGATVEEGKLE